MPFEGAYHVRSYIRCLGFLYLRYTYPPAKLMEWFEDFLGDEEKVKLRAGDQTTTYVVRRSAETPWTGAHASPTFCLGVLSFWGCVGGPSFLLGSFLTLTVSSGLGGSLACALEWATGNRRRVVRARALAWLGVARWLLGGGGTLCSSRCLRCLRVHVRAHVDPCPSSLSHRTVGQFVRDLLLNKKYMGATMLPTIPVPVMKSIEDTIRKFDEETAEETKEPSRAGRDDDDDDDRRPAAVRRYRQCGTAGRGERCLDSDRGLHWSLQVAAAAAGSARRQPEPRALALARVRARPPVRSFLRSRSWRSVGSGPGGPRGP